MNMMKREKILKMPLSEQIYIPSVATDAFYTPEEEYIHKRLLKLYKLLKNEKAKEKRDWRIKSINRVIKKEKAKLSLLLKQNLDAGITRELNPVAICPKNTINLFCSELTRSLEIPPMQFSDSIIIVSVFFFEILNSIIHKGFNYNGEHYIFFSCGAGMIRTKRFMALKEKDYKRIELKLMCGLTLDDINKAGGMNENKLMAYLSLQSSATDVWNDFDINKCIVVDDFEMPVVSQSDFIDYNDYSITRKEGETVIAETDGWGMCCIPNFKTKIIRAPWIKGLLTYFDFQKWLRQKCDKDEWIVSDIWGKKWNIILDDIKVILTKSQFKLYKFYSSWQQYKDMFVAYGCHCCYCKEEEDYIPKARINYQMLQSLSDMTDAEIEKIIGKTKTEIQNIGKDYRLTMRLLGATEQNKNKLAMQKALMIYPELFRDSYNKEILKQTKKSLITQAKGGRLRVNGKYVFISPDPYAFCQWLFKGDMHPNGLLNDGEVYCNQYKDGDELDCLRSPHLYQEHAVRVNKRNKETDKWLGATKCLYVATTDMISRILQADFDGDISLVIKDKTICSVAKRNMKNIVPLSYDLKKAKGGIIDADRLYNGISTAYTGGNIGVISNDITKVKNAGRTMTDEQIKVISWLTMKNNQVIDFAKTLWKSEPPEDIAEIIKSYTNAKMPYFFMYAKGKTREQVADPNDSVMNRICMAIPNEKLSYCKTVGKFDYRDMMNGDVDFTVDDDSPVIVSYNYWLRHQHLFNEDNKDIKDDNLYAVHYISNEILKDSNNDIDYVVNSLVAYNYTIKKSSNKKLLWACFGDKIVENLERNLKDKGKVCPVCGKRFKDDSYDSLSLYCSDSCKKAAKREMNNMYNEAPKAVDFDEI